MSFADPLKPTMSDFQLKVTANDSNLKKKKKERMFVSRIFRTKGIGRVSSYKKKKKKI